MLQPPFEISVWDPRAAIQFQTPRTDPLGLSTATLTQADAEQLGEQAAMGRSNDDRDASDGEVEVEEYEILTDFKNNLHQTMGGW